MRTQINELVLARFQSNVYRPGSGALVNVYEVDGVTPATVYDSLEGTGTLGQPLTVDDNGKIPGYLEEDTYVFVITYRGDTETRVIEASSGRGGPRRAGIFGSMLGIGHSYGTGGGTLKPPRSGFMQKVARALHLQRFHDACVGGTQFCYGLATTSGSGHWGRTNQVITRDRQAAPWLPAHDIVVAIGGLNDLAQLGSLHLNPFIEAWRTILARARSASIFEESHASVVKTGTWSNFGIEQASGAAYSLTSTVNDKVVITTPTSYKAGCPVTVQLIVDPTYRYTLTPKLDGVVAADYVVDANKQDQGANGVGQINALAYRLPNGFPTDGAHTLELQMTARTAGFFIFDCWLIEAHPDDGPLLVLPLPSKCVGYTLWNTAGGWAHGYNAGTDPMNDAGVDVLKAAMKALHTEFPNVLEIDVDTLLNKNPLFFSIDNAHPNELGHAKIAEETAEKIILSALAEPDISFKSTFPDQPLWTPLKGWGGPGYVNGWTDHATAPAGAFEFGLDGRVRLRGNITNPTPANWGTVICTMPAGLRPSGSRYFPVPVQGGGFALLQVLSNGTIAVIGMPIPAALLGSKTYDPPSMANGANDVTTVTVTGAQIGDTVEVSHDKVLGNQFLIQGVVSAADTVTVFMRNLSNSTVDLASGTLRAVVTPKDRTTLAASLVVLEGIKWAAEL